MRDVGITSFTKKRNNPEKYYIWWNTYDQESLIREALKENKIVFEPVLICWK